MSEVAHVSVTMVDKNTTTLLRATFTKNYTLKEWRRPKEQGIGRDMMLIKISGGVSAT